jgi:hypothetical protein
MATRAGRELPGVGSDPRAGVRFSANYVAIDLEQGHLM